MKKKTELGQKLLAAMHEAVAVERGEKRAGRVTKRSLVDEPPVWTPQAIKKLRDSLSVSQSGLANLLNVKTETVSAWEQGVNDLSGLARRVLQILSIEPRVLKKLPKKHIA